MVSTPPQERTGNNGAPPRVRDVRPVVELGPLVRELFPRETNDEEVEDGSSPGKAIGIS